MSMSKHAKLPASAAHRWTVCPASAYMDEDSDRRGSKYAAEGTAAHFLVEECLVDNLNLKDQIGRRIYIDEKGDAGWMAESAPTFGTPDEWIFEVDSDMVDAAALFIQVTEDALITMDPNGVQYVEEKVSPGHPSLGGTLDWAYVSENRAAIADLKYGRGVVVDVQDNPQQMIYALGLLANHPEVKWVDSYIVQPRAPHADGPIRWVTYSAEELQNFYTWLLERIEAADKPGAPRIPGDHCRFCPDLAACPAVLKMAQDAAAIEFADAEFSVDDLSEKVAEALSFVATVEAWIKAVRKRALKILMDDGEVQGWKLVHGRGTRAWTAEEIEVIKIARTVGLLKKACFSEPKFLSPYGMEQAATKRGQLSSLEAKRQFRNLWETVPGGPTIAPEDDPRKLYERSPEEDFEIV